MAEEKVEKLYEMLFPYGTYNGNRANTCILIEKELRQLCRQETRHVLLLIARFLEIEFTRGTPTPTICGKIQKDIQKSCLNIGSDMAKASYMIGRVTGIPPVKSEILSYEDRKFCQNNNSAIYKPPIWSRAIFNHLEKNKQYVHIPTFKPYSIPTLKSYSIKDAERFWNNPDTRTYVYVPSLRVMGNPDDIREYFKIYVGFNMASINYDLSKSYTVHNYNNIFKNAYDRELLDARDAPDIDIFEKNKDIERYIRNSLSSTNPPEGFVDRIVTGIREGSIPLTLNGKPAKWSDICK